MNLLPSDEQQEIISVVRSFLAARLPTSSIRDRRNKSSCIAGDVWSECGALGWFGLGLDEQFGGIGYGMAEQALLLREIGRHLASGPFIATILGARVAALAGERDVARAIVTGEAMVCLAEPRAGAVVGPTLSGTFDLLDAPGAGYALVATPECAVLMSMDSLAHARMLPSIDPAVRLSQVELTNALPLALVMADLDPVFVRATVLVAAMMTGIAEATRDIASQYAKDREQFGRPIGINQAIKHACADMATRSEAAGSQLLFAALSVDEARGDRDFQATSARIVAGHAAIQNAAANVQVHGGIGYTFEHDAHLFVKRASVLDRMFGSSRRHLASLLQMSGPQ